MQLMLTVWLTGGRAGVPQGMTKQLLFHNVHAMMFVAC
jgi:hypothetical protein